LAYYCGSKFFTFPFSLFLSNGFVLEVQPLACEWMAEREAFSVKVEAVGGCAVEDVAFDGAAKSFGMGAMDAELVGASAFGIEFDAAGRGELVVSEGGFAETGVDHLARSVAGVP
jgi:hypothetical protein